MRLGEHKKWSIKLDSQLLSEISKGKGYIALEISIGRSLSSINKRLKEMGFENFRDARKVLFK